jgi:hypothetical protein
MHLAERDADTRLTRHQILLSRSRALTDYYLSEGLFRALRLREGRLMKTAKVFAFLLLGTEAIAAPARAVTYTATLLQSAGFTGSVANAISDANQVGYGYESASGRSHALLWGGSAVSVVDLNPSGFDGSSAVGVSGANQVGSGGGLATGGRSHALL